jgi:uncharacterized Tic20 family protein
MNQQQNSILGTDDQPLYTPTSDERTMAILSHILCLVFWLFPPLIIYLIKKDESQYVAAHAKESLNFQITIMLAVIASIVLMIVLIGILLLWVVGIASMVLVIIATIKASENKLYRYPFTIRLIK